MVYLNQPANFQKLFSLVSCIFIVGDKTLLLHRPKDKSQGNKWGIPAGKLEQGESSQEGVVREVEEETGLDIDLSDMKYFRKFWVDTQGKQFEYEIYYCKLNKPPVIKLNDNEHDRFKWVRLRDSLKEDLIEDHPYCMKLFLEYINQ